MYWLRLLIGGWWRIGLIGLMWCGELWFVVIFGGDRLVFVFIRDLVVDCIGVVVVVVLICIC